jgi:hypothetical protein
MIAVAVIRVVTGLHMTGASTSSRRALDGVLIWRS